MNVKTMILMMVISSFCLFTLHCNEDPFPFSQTSFPSIEEGSYYSNENGLFDHHHRELILRGVNMENRSKSVPRHIPTLKKSDFQRLSDWGMNAIRLLVFWMAIEPEKGIYDTEYIENIAVRVRWAAENNLYVIIDFHQDVFGEGFGADFNGAPAWACDQSYYDSFTRTNPWYVNYFSDEVKACFDHLWSDTDTQNSLIEAMTLMLSYFSDEKAVIGVDLINEPFCGSYPEGECDAILSDFYEKAAHSINKVAPGKLFFCEHSYVDNAGTPTSIQLDFNNAVYAPHFYYPSVDFFQEYNLNKDGIRNQIDIRRREAQEFGVPLFIGEYGGDTNTTNFIPFIDDNMDIFDELQASATYYEYGYAWSTYSILDSQGNEKEFVDALVRPFPQAVAGKIISFSFEYDTKTFELIASGEPGIKEPTIITIPERHYPDSINVEGCDDLDCQWEHSKEDKRLYIWFKDYREYHIVVTNP